MTIKINGRTKVRISKSRISLFYKYTTSSKPRQTLDLRSLSLQKTPEYSAPPVTKFTAQEKPRFGLMPETKKAKEKEL
jgi:hypothetical protein